MKDAKVGQLLSAKRLPARDAIHVAIFPMICGEDFLSPGQPVRIKRGTSNVALCGRYSELDGRNADSAIGIVDPFIQDAILRKGDAFYAFLYPGTVTGMQHQWKHPYIDNPVDTRDDSESEKWLREFADKYNFNYTDMIDNASAPASMYRYVTARGKDLHGAEDLDPGEEDAFWEHMTILTKREYDQGTRDSLSWSCSC
jgi:hypothetical protein